MNIQNVIHLIKRYFIENRRKDITTAITLILVIAIIGFLQPVGQVSTSLTTFIFCILGWVFAGHIFGIFQPASKAIHYLTIPASNAEKTLVNAGLIYLYYNILLLVSLFIGTLIGELLHKLIFHQGWIELYLPFDWSNLTFLLLGESIFLFASIFFKTHPIIKACLCILLFGLFFLILSSILLGLSMQSMDSNWMLHFQTSLENINFEWIGYSIFAILFIFFNLMTWLRLKKTEA